MAEAMISEKYVQATLPTLQVVSAQSCSPSRRSETQPDHNAFHDSADARNPTNTSHQQRKYKVNFEVPPTKRSRRGVNDNIQNVIAAIQTCITAHDRLEAIYDACIKFDHDIQTLHDTEISMGADIALFKHLPFLVLKKQRMLANKSSTSHEEYISIVEEISNTFTAFEMVLRCSAESVSTCFARIGSELFPILLDFIQSLTFELSKERNERASSTLFATEIQHQNHGDGLHQDSDRGSKASTPTQSCDGSSNSIKKLEPEGEFATNPANETLNSKIASKVTLKTCTKIIGHFARVGSLTEALANTPMLLDTLCSVITSNPTDNLPLEARLNCLWVIANLACSAENMVLMSKHPRLLDTLFEIISHPDTNEENNCQDIDQFIGLLRTRSVAVRAILNLSWAQENKIPFSENIDLVENLLRIASHRKSSWAGSGRGVSAILLQSRRHACGTLRNIAAAPRKYKRRLCRMKTGKFLDILADIAKSDNDSEVRSKIHATLFNLVSADTAKLFTEKKNVLDVIIATATTDEANYDENFGAVNNNNNIKGGSRKMAEDTLRSLEKALPEDDEAYDILRPTLSRFDSQIAMNRTNSNLGSVTISITNLGNLPSISNFSLGDISNSNFNTETL